MRAWDYPFDTVVVQCEPCKREGRYSKARFIELVGRHTALPDALRIIAKDCPKAETQLTGLHDLCKAHYPELRDRRSKAEQAADGPG